MSEPEAPYGTGILRKISEHGRVERPAGVTRSAREHFAHESACGDFARHDDVVERDVRVLQRRERMDLQADARAELLPTENGVDAQPFGAQRNEAAWLAFAHDQEEEHRSRIGLEVLEIVSIPLRVVPEAGLLELIVEAD